MTRKTQKAKSGFTLVEVLISALIIAILVIGGSAALYHTGSSILVTGNKRIALEIANQRLELAKANPYTDIAPDYYDGSNANKYLKPSKTDPDILVVTLSAAYDNIILDGVTYKMRTKVIRYHAGDGPANFDTECVKVTVSVLYNADTGETVDLDTIIIPPWVTYES